jgi:hypothetical protein
MKLNSTFNEHIPALKWRRRTKEEQCPHKPSVAKIKTKTKQTACAFSILSGRVMNWRGGCWL